MRYRWIFAALGGGLACAMPASAGEHAFGQALSETNCAECHAIGIDDQSAHAEAPAFRTLLQRYPVDALEEGFAHSIVTDHPDMPEFLATPEEVSAIIGYIQSIQVQP